MTNKDCVKCHSSTLHVYIRSSCNSDDSMPALFLARRHVQRFWIETIATDSTDYRAWRPGYPPRASRSSTNEELQLLQSINKTILTTAACDLYLVRLATMETASICLTNFDENRADDTECNFSRPQDLAGLQELPAPRKPKYSILFCIWHKIKSYVYTMKG